MFERISLQADCDPTKPEEHLLWALNQIQMGNEMIPIPPNIAKTMSKHLYELGFRHHPRLQTKKLQLPHRGQQHYMNGLARWVPMDAPEPDPVVLPDVRKMTTHEQELIETELRAIGKIVDPPPRRGILAEETSFAEVRRKVQSFEELRNRPDVTIVRKHPENEE